LKSIKILKNKLKLQSVKSDWEFLIDYNRFYLDKCDLYLRTIIILKLIKHEIDQEFSDAPNRLFIINHILI